MFEFEFKLNEEREEVDHREMRVLTNLESIENGLCKTANKLKTLLRNTVNQNTVHFI